jgi:xylan 1,4-beta-xylosidase
MIAHVVAGCLPSCQAMSHWVLSGTYEELGVAEHIITEGTSSYSLLYAGGIAKPSFNTYKLLHSLGNERLAATGPVLASQRANRSVSALIWNLADVPQLSGIPDSTSTRSVKGEAKRYQVEFAGARSGQRVKVSFVDQERGSAIPAWRAMGSPQYIKPAQIAELTKRADIAPPITMKLNAARQLTVDLPPEGVALLELI